MSNKLTRTISSLIFIVSVITLTNLVVTIVGGDLSFLKVVTLGAISVLVITITREILKRPIKNWFDDDGDDDDNNDADASLFANILIIALILLSYAAYIHMAFT